LERRSISLLRGGAMFVPFYSATMLAFESCGVVGLRMAMLMTGREWEAEMQLMVSEKIDAMFEAAASLVAGGTAASVVDRYREHVAANAERLAR
jgi:hypothetical protein